MAKHSRRPALAPATWFIVIALVLSTMSHVTAHEPSFEQDAWTATQTVTLDGVLGATEWQDTPEITVEGLAGQASSVIAHVKQEGTSLHIGLEKESLGGNNNRVTFFFDVNHDGALDSGDRAVQLEYTAQAIGSTLYYQGDGTGQWVAASPAPLWSFARSGDQLEAQIALADLGLSSPSEGDIVGFALVTCDRTTTSETVGWPDYALNTGNACQDVNTLTYGTAPTEWGNLAYTTSEYPGVSADTTSWDSFGFENYTYRGQPITDWETSADPSNGGAAVQPDDIDVASDTLSADPGGNTSVEVAFYDHATPAAGACDASRQDDLVAFRIWLDGDPHFKTGYKSRHWNVTIDVDGDGYKEFWFDLDGSYSQNSRDILHLYYEDLDQQDLVDPDAALKYVFPADSVDDDNDVDTPNGSSDSFTRYGRTARGDEGTDYDYYIDMKLPVKYLDLADNGLEDCSISSATPLGLFYSTSASNTDPLQKDWMMDPDGQADAWTPDRAITFGDTITLDPTAGGAFKLTPLQYDETVGPGTVLNFAHVVENVGTTSADLSFSATVSGTCGTVTLYLDDNQNGVRDTGEDTVLASQSGVASGAQVYLIAEVTAGASGTCEIDVSVSDSTDTKSADDNYTVHPKESAVKLNELLYDSTGSEWLELVNASTYARADISGWQITDNDGHTYTLPALADMPSASQCGGDEARVVVVFESGTDETDWSDCLVTLYAGSGDWFEDDADDVSLCTEACSSSTVVDYVAYGAHAESDDDDAIEARLWTSLTYAQTVPTDHSLSRLRTAALRDGYDTNSYQDWYDANAPSPGEENTPHLVINEVEYDSTTVDWAELYVVEDGVAGAYGIDIAPYVLTDLDGSDTALAATTVSALSQDYVRIHWSAGTDETDSECSLVDCGEYRDLYVSDTAPNVTTDDQLALYTAGSGGQIVDALAWDGGDNVWCTTCGDGSTDESADAAALASYAVNGISVPMWASVDASDAVSGESETGGSTIGRDALSTDGGVASDWDDTGGADAVGQTPGARNVGVLINEIMFDPLSGSEWVELYCGSAIDFAATSYRLEYGSGSTNIGTGYSCPAGGYLQISVGTLGDSSDAISLCSGTSGCTQANTVDFAAYGANPGTNDDTAVAAGIWTDGDLIPLGGIRTGESIGRDRDQTETDRSLDWNTHGGPDAIGPTPGARNLGSTVLINEVMFDPSTGYEWVELYNPTGNEIDLDGFVIQDGDGNSYTIPTDLEPIPADAYLIIYLDDGGNAGSDDYTWLDGDYAQLHADLAASSDSDSLQTTDQLSLCSATCSSGTIQDFVAWGSAPTTEDDDAVSAGIWDAEDALDVSAVSAGESIGRDKDSLDLDQPEDWLDHGGSDAVGITPGAQNVGSVILNEIAYNQSTVDWIELYNPTDQNLDLDDFCLSLDNGTSCYDLPDVLQRIPSGEYLIIRFGVGSDDTEWSDGDIAEIYTCGSDSCAAGELDGLGSSAALSLYSSATSPGSTTIVDFCAYGGDPGTADGDAVTAGLWDDGDYADLSLAADETMGRDKDSTDTGQPADWAGTGGADAEQETYGYRNYTNAFEPAGNPTAVTVMSFGAFPLENAIRIQWTAFGDLDTLGFNLHRQSLGETDFIRLNGALIPGPMAAPQELYAWTDPNVQPDRIYRYRLESIDLQGHSTWHGVTEATLRTSVKLFTIHLASIWKE